MRSTAFASLDRTAAKVPLPLARPRGGRDAIRPPAPRERLQREMGNHAFRQAAAGERPLGQRCACGGTCAHCRGEELGMEPPVLRMQRLAEAGGAAGWIQRQAREGTTELAETVATPPVLGGGVYRGQVVRTVTAPASGTQPRQQVGSATVAVEFDSTGCLVRLPHSYFFTPGQAAASDICAGPPPLSQAVPPVPPARLLEIQTSFLSTVEEGLNGWYAVRLEGDGCESACAGRDLPIRVVPFLAANAAAANSPITVVNRGGRADSGTICAGAYNPETMVHEAGHQVLGAGDEYRETDPAALARAPRWGRSERVRTTDWSRMSEHHSYGRFALFHERHFQHVPVFLRSVFPGCRARLVELRRPVLPDFRVQLGVGYAALGGANLAGGMFADLGLAVGVPMSRLRDWEVLMGVHGRLLAQLEDSHRLAVLLGLRLGLEHSWTPSAGGVRLGAFGEVGAGWFSPPSIPGTSGSGLQARPYGELGLAAGYRTGGERAVSAGVEFGAGTSFGPSPTPGLGPAVPRDEENMRWLRLGLRLATEF